MTSLPESLARVAELTEPAGAKQSRGYTGEFGYEGPCPGPSEHTYEFELYAMPTATLAEVTTNSSMEELEAAIEANALASTTLQAVFTPPQ